MAARQPVAYLYLAPALLIYGLLVIAPVIYAVWVSFFEWDGVGTSVWVGAENYVSAFTDERLLDAFTHALVLVFFYCVLPVLLGLLLATSMSRVKVRGLAFYRAVLFLPQILPLVAVGIVWQYVYEPNDGPLNGFLGFLGLDGVQRTWLGDFTWALPALGLAGTWVLFGLCMVLFIAGVQKIPPSLYDAARVDGAGPVREFLAVTLPGLRGEIVVAIVLTMILALRSFDMIAVTTKGGPGDATNVPAFEIYQRAFTYAEVGSASAVAVMLGIVVFLAAALARLLGERG